MATKTKKMLSRLWRVGCLAGVMILMIGIDVFAQSAQPAPPATRPATAPTARGGRRGGGGGFTEPQPLNFNDHEGYISLFDGKTLKGWDGNSKFWRVEDGAIIGESTAQNPSGNNYMAYRDI